MNKLKNFIFPSFMGRFGPADTTEGFFFSFSKRVSSSIYFYLTIVMTN